MKRKLFSFIGLIILLNLICFQFVSCFIEHEIIAFSYEELSDGLEKIAIVDASGVEHGEEEKILRILTDEETENVLSKIGNMSFETTFYGPEPNEFMGTTLVFYYPTYKLYFSSTIIMKKNLDPDSKDRGYFYSVNQNEYFIELVSYVSNE